MNRYLFFIALILFGSCSSSKNTMLGEQREAIEESVKDDKFHGDPLPDWTKQSGIENGRAFTVGIASYPADKPQILVEKAAYMDGESKLVSEAPTDVRVLTQTAMDSSIGNSVQFSEVQTRLRRLSGLSGIKYHRNKITCRKVVRYGTFATVIDRQCWAMVSVPIQSLKVAYERTIEQMYGDSKAKAFSKKMEEEIKKIDGR